MSAPTLEQVHLAKLLRRDVEPNEAKVRVRVKTCSTGFIWRGQNLGMDSDAFKTAEVDPTIPLRFAWVDVEMHAADVAALRAEVEAKRATPKQVEKAVEDLRADLLKLEAVSPDASAADIVAAFDSGEIKGKTDKQYRPAFAASFFHMNRDARGEGVEFYPIVAIEVADDEKKTRKAA